MSVGMQDKPFIDYICNEYFHWDGFTSRTVWPHVQKLLKQNPRKYATLRAMRDLICGPLFVNAVCSTCCSKHFSHLDQFATRMTVAELHRLLTTIVEKRPALSVAAIEWIRREISTDMIATRIRPWHVDGSLNCNDDTALMWDMREYRRLRGTA